MGKYVSRNIDSLHPQVFVIARDGSSSMKGGIGGTSVSKADMTATIINSAIQELEGMASKSGIMKPYFLFSLVDYAGDKEVQVGFPGFTDQVVSIVDLSKNPIRRETRNKKEPDGVGGFIEIPVEFPIWVEPKLNGNTPMREAFEEIAKIIAGVATQYMECHPFVIVNVTDGNPTGASFEEVITASKKITSQETNFGNMLLFNAHITDVATTPILYPASDEKLDSYGKFLFAMSSVIPEPMRLRAVNAGIDIEPGARGLIVNGDAASLKSMFDVGTISTEIPDEDPADDEEDEE